MLTYSQQQLCLQMKTNHKQDTDMLSPLAFFFFPTRFHFFSSFYSFPLFPSYDFVCSPRHCENNRWGTSWWCVFLCVRAQWVCLIEMLIGSNETSAIMWLQTRFPNKRRMLSVASRVFHWNHTFIQPVSCPGVFLSAWADEEREPSVSLSCSLLFPLSLSPPSPHPSSHPFHHPPPPNRSGSVDVGYRSSDFLSLCWIVLLCLWSEKKHMTHKVSQTNSGLLLRKWWWIRREGVFLGLLLETHTYPRTQHTLMRAYSWVAKKTPKVSELMEFLV